MKDREGGRTMEAGGWIRWEHPTRMSWRCFGPKNHPTFTIAPFVANLVPSKARSATFVASDRSVRSDAQTAPFVANLVPRRYAVKDLCEGKSHQEGENHTKPSRYFLCEGFMSFENHQITWPTPSDLVSMSERRRTTRHGGLVRFLR